MMPRHGSSKENRRRGARPSGASPFPFRHMMGLLVAAALVAVGVLVIRPLLDPPAAPTDPSTPANTTSVPPATEPRTTPKVSEPLQIILTEPAKPGSDAETDEGSVTAYRPPLEALADPLAQTPERFIPFHYDNEVTVRPPGMIPTESGEDGTPEEPEEPKDVIDISDAADRLYYEALTPSLKGLNVYLGTLDGEPLYGKNAKISGWPASLTKMMTAIVLLESDVGLNDTLTVTDEMIRHVADLNASLAGFTPGETLTYRDLLYAAMLPSAGDAAYAIACGVAGSEAAFVDAMNAKAEAIGMKDSHFTNATGLHEDDQYATAEDLARLLSYGWQNPIFREVVSTRRYTTESTDEHPEGLGFSHTILRVVDRYAETEGALPFEILGGKSGYTIVGGQCWATVCSVDGKEYVAVTLGSRTEPDALSSPYVDTVNMLSGLTEAAVPLVQPVDTYTVAPSP